MNIFQKQLIFGDGETMQEKYENNISLSSCKQKIESLEEINKELLGACKSTLSFLEDGGRKELTIEFLQQAIARAGRGE